MAKSENAKSIMVDGVNIGKLGTIEHSKSIVLSGCGEERDREEDTLRKSPSKASQGTIVRKTQYWPLLKKMIYVSSALMNSQVRRAVV